MAKKLSDLVQSAVHVLGSTVSEQTMRSRVMLLRKAGLWSSKGRGISAEPVASDATNLLLSILGGGLVTATADTVGLLRQSFHVSNLKTENPRTFFPLPPVSVFDELERGHTLGQMLDALFLDYAKRGGAWSHKHNVPITNIFLDIERHALGWETELFLDDGNDKWSVAYMYSVVPFGLEFDEMDRRTVAAIRERGDLNSILRVSMKTFSALAKCLSEDADSVSTHQEIPERRRTDELG